MPNATFSRPIPKWQAQGGDDSPASSPQLLAAVEWEGSYLLPQWQATAEPPISAAQSSPPARAKPWLSLWRALRVKPRPANPWHRAQLSQ
ncbi:hypothetical protein ACVW0Y_003106 [Pseudomonas sp. TE3786]